MAERSPGPPCLNSVVLYLYELPRAEGARMCSFTERQGYVRVYRPVSRSYLRFRSLGSAWQILPSPQPSLSLLCRKGDPCPFLE